MSIELKVGEWYETRMGSRVRVIADVRDIPARSCAGDIFVAAWKGGDLTSFHPNGAYTSGGPSHDDIVKHLPGCTGWDWQEPKWRDARPEDALCDPPLRCRVRDHELREWSTDPLLLIGVVQYPPSAPARYHTKWGTYLVGEGRHFTTWWGYCQVLDK